MHCCSDTTNSICIFQVQYGNKKNDYYDSIELFKSLVNQISNLTREIKSQHECIASFTQTTQMLFEQFNKQQRDYELLSKIVGKKVKDQDVLINDLKEMKMKCDIHQLD